LVSVGYWGASFVAMWCYCGFATFVGVSCCRNCCISISGLWSGIDYFCVCDCIGVVFGTAWIACVCVLVVDVVRLPGLFVSGASSPPRLKNPVVCLIPLMPLPALLF
jgi:hypothetical protein